MDPVQTGAAIAGGIITVGGALTVVWRTTRLVVRMSRRISDLYDDWQGEPGRAGVSPRPGVMERLATLENDIHAVKRELHPNGGSSLRDAMNRVEAKVGAQPVQVNVGMPPAPTTEGAQHA